MKNTLIYCILIGFILFVLSACSDAYSVDYSSLDFPPTSKKDQTFIDSTLKANQLGSDKKLHAQTDRKKYRIDEEITLTVVNNTGKTVYIYPSDVESKCSLATFSYDDKELKKLYLKAVISEDNGLLGGMSYLDPCFIGLHLSGSNSATVSKLGFEGFDQPLESGKKLVFNVKMPKRAGHYYFLIKKYSHGPDKIGYWGYNQFIYSNAFEILDK
nr:hypothetical protein [uncultured Fluviicola sp.]